MSDEDSNNERNCQCSYLVKMANPNNIQRWHILCIIGWAAASFPGFIFAGTNDTPALLSALSIITVVLVVINIVFHKFKPWSFALTMGFYLLNIVFLLLVNIIHNVILGSSSFDMSTVVSSFGYIATCLYGFSVMAGSLTALLFYVKGPETPELPRTASQIVRSLRDAITAQIDLERASEPPPPYEEVIQKKSTSNIDGLPSYGDVLGGQVTVITTAHETRTNTNTVHHRANETPTSINMEQPTANETPTNTNMEQSTASETPTNTNMEQSRTNETPTNTNTEQSTANETPTNTNMEQFRTNETSTNTNMEQPRANETSTNTNMEPSRANDSNEERPPLYTISDGRL